MKNPDVPKDLPVLIRAKRPTLGQLSSIPVDEVLRGDHRAMPKGNNGQLPVAAFNSSV